MSDVADRFTKPNWDLSRPGRRATPLRRDEALALLRAHAAEIERRTHVRPVALFGSVARDEATVGSDVDVLVEYVGPVGWTELAHTPRCTWKCCSTRGSTSCSWDALRPRGRPYVEPDLLHAA